MLPSLTRLVKRLFDMQSEFLWHTNAKGSKVPLPFTFHSRSKCYAVHNLLSYHQRQRPSALRISGAGQLRRERCNHHQFYEQDAAILGEAFHRSRYIKAPSNFLHSGCADPPFYHSTRRLTPRRLRSSRFSAIAPSRRGPRGLFNCRGWGQSRGDAERRQVRQKAAAHVELRRGAAPKST
jgi:hypothetical protein